MTIRANRFTPHALISAPQRGPGTPNHDGSAVLYTISAYSFETKLTTTEVRLLDVVSGESQLLDDSGKLQVPVWLQGSTVAALRTVGADTSAETSTSPSSNSASSAATELLVGDAKNWDKTKYRAGRIGGAASTLKVAPLDDEQHSFALAFSAMANPDGSMYSAATEDAAKQNGEKEDKQAKEKAKPTSGRLYHSNFVRHWNVWIKPERPAVWYATLHLPRSNSDIDGDSTGHKYRLSSPFNILAGTNIESPIPQSDPSKSFDVSRSGVVFVAKDPDRDQALNTSCSLYYMPTLELEKTAQSADPAAAAQEARLYNIETGGDFGGAMTSPRFSRDGKQIVYLHMRTNGYEADQNHVFWIPDTNKPMVIKHILASKDGRARWTLSPTSAQFNNDGSELLLVAQAETIAALFYYLLPKISKQAEEQEQSFPFSLPVQLTRSKSVASVVPLSNSNVSSRIFVSQSSMLDSSIYTVVETLRYSPASSRVPASSPTTTVTMLSSASQNGSLFGLSESQISTFWYPASKKNIITDNKTQALIILPSNFDRCKKYPLAMIIHGGPQEAWSDQWLVRWSPLVYAEQGYVVVMPNPTGTPGYGQTFTDAIREDWGGAPYEDLVNCFSYIEEQLGFVDVDRAVALGPSFGGFMINWIQGHPLGRRFKALVCHDGIFHIAYGQATDELWFVNWEQGGSWTDARAKWGRWNPADHTEHWQTPQLVIHNDYDFRLTMADGIAAFNTLQSKGIESQFLSFLDEGHVVLKPENSLIWYEVVLNWINKFVGLPGYRLKDLDRITMDPPRGNSSVKSRIITLKAE